MLFPLIAPTLASDKSAGSGTLEDEDGQINCLVWPSLVETFRHQILTSRLLKVRGKVQESHGVIHIIADTLEDASEWLGDLKPSSRDFH